MPLSPLLVLEAGSGTKFQLLPLFNIVGPFLGLTRNLGAHQNKDVELVKVPYQQAVGSLMYAMLYNRLDLAYLISVVNQHMTNPSLEH